MSLIEKNIGSAKGISRRSFLGMASGVVGMSFLGVDVSKSADSAWGLGNLILQGQDLFVSRGTEMIKNHALQDPRIYKITAVSREEDWLGAMDKGSLPFSELHSLLINFFNPHLKIAAGIPRTPSWRSEKNAPVEVKVSDDNMNPDIFITTRTFQLEPNITFVDQSQLEKQSKELKKAGKISFEAGRFNPFMSQLSAIGRLELVQSDPAEITFAPTSRIDQALRNDESLEDIGTTLGYSFLKNHPTPNSIHLFCPFAPDKSGETDAWAVVFHDRGMFYRRLLSRGELVLDKNHPWYQYPS